MNGPWRGIREKSTRAGVSCLVLLMMGTSHPMTGQDYYPTPTSLKGLKGVFIQISANTGFAAADRSLQQTLETLAEERLIEVGIAVLARKDWERLPDAARMQLGVIVTCEASGATCGYSAVLHLAQHVQLTRDPHDIITATTWSNSYTGSISKAELVVLPVPNPLTWNYPRLVDDAGTLLVGFIRQFRTANPH